MKGLRRFWIEGVVFLCGIVLGGGTYAYLELAVAPSKEDAAATMNMFRMAEWTGIVSEALTREKPAIAMLALESFICLSEKRYVSLKDEVDDKWVFRADLVLAYGRRAVVARALGDEKKYDESVSRALAYAKATKTLDVWSKIKTEDDLLETVGKISKFGPKIQSKIETSEESPDTSKEVSGLN